MAETKTKYSINDFEDRFTSPFIGNWKPPKQSVKKTTRKSGKKATAKKKG